MRGNLCSNVQSELVIIICVPDIVSFRQPPHPPLVLALAGRFNLNGVYQLALNSDCRSEQVLARPALDGT